ncbi:MAG TPA: protocatechuate 3,4-dioxygenase subunit alpha [Myxococcales bacterium]|nr:protocatechuate 3,4-dioxygenase subunit alpha [Myxococcales bacterium]
MPTRGPTPSQTVGPFFALGLGPGWTDLTEGAGGGDRIVIEGQIIDGDGRPVPDALLEIWQADPQGRYPDPADPAQSPRFRGFGRALTDSRGAYRFTTVKPGRVQGAGGALQAPHLNLILFARGLLRHLTTRIYFADDPSNDADPILAAVSDPAARRTLLATRQAAAAADPSQPRQPGSPQAPTYRFDVILQGEGETAFFDV